MNSPKDFVIIGVGGYIAPRHLKAIKDTGNNLVAAMDINDSVGILDSMFPHVPFFTRFEDFDRYVDDLRFNGNKIDYVSICTPNFMHSSHIRFALKQGANAICEKPLVIEPWELDELEEFEKKQGNGKVYTILQVRELPSIRELKEKIDKEKRKDKYDVELTYITHRGPWYYQSWKGDLSKSGGLAMNIGIHFFDMLIWMFGQPINIEVYKNTPGVICGYLELEKANVKWYLSIDRNDLEKVGEKEKSAFRSIKFDGKEVEFSNVFKELHTVVYEKILNDEGPRLNDAKPVIDLLHKLRNTYVSKPKKDRGHKLL